MKYVALLLALIFFVSSAHALNVEFDSKHQIVPVSTANNTTTATISGTVEGVLNDYSYIIYGPGQKIIANGTGVLNNSAFSFSFGIPSIDEFISLGIESADNRAVIPLHVQLTFTGTTAVLNETTNQTVNITAETTARALVLVATDKFQERISNLARRFENLENFANRLAERLEKIASRLEARERDNAAALVEEKAALARNVAEKSAALKEKIEQLDINKKFAGDELKDAYSELRDSVRDLRDSLQDIRQSINKIRERRNK